MSDEKRPQNARHRVELEIKPHSQIGGDFLQGGKPISFNWRKSSPGITTNGGTAPAVKDWPSKQSAGGL